MVSRSFSILAIGYIPLGEFYCVSIIAWCLGNICKVSQMWPDLPSWRRAQASLSERHTLPLGWARADWRFRLPNGAAAQKQAHGWRRELLLGGKHPYHYTPCTPWFHFWIYTLLFLLYFLFFTKCYREEQIWLHTGSVSFTLTFVFYCFCYKFITKGMLPIT